MNQYKIFTLVAIFVIIFLVSYWYFYKSLYALEEFKKENIGKMKYVSFGLLPNPNQTVSSYKEFIDKSLQILQPRVLEFKNVYSKFPELVKMGENVWFPNADDAVFDVALEISVNGTDMFQRLKDIVYVLTMLPKTEDNYKKQIIQTVIELSNFLVYEYGKLMTEAMNQIETDIYKAYLRPSVNRLETKRKELEAEIRENIEFEIRKQWVV